MRVVFLESVEGTAQVGEVKEVKNGFARNYLLPRGLAAPAVEPYLRRAEARAVREAKRQEALDQDASAVAERLEGERITISARVGEQGKLYGSVTSVRIAEEVAKLMAGEEFDHRKVLLPEAIKEVGIQPIRLRLTRNVEAAIEVEVIAEGAEAEEEPSEEEQEELEGGAEAVERPRAGLEETDEAEELPSEEDRAESEAGVADTEEPPAELEETGAVQEQPSVDQPEEEQA
jgi:large subunit ribosomal protein L9